MRIAIMDDHLAVAEALAVVLRSIGALAWVIGTKIEGLARTDFTQADVVLIGVAQPRTNVLETIRVMRRTYPALLIVALSNYPGGRDWPGLMRAGAHRIASKADSLDGLLKTILAWNEPCHSQDLPNEEERLPSPPTPRQMNVLLGIARGLSRGEIAKNEGLSVARVDEHIAVLKQKLGAARCSDLVLGAVERGWIEPRVPPPAR